MIEENICVEKGNIIKKGNNYRTYSYYVHVFEADVDKVMVQSNSDNIIRKIAEALKGRGIKCESSGHFMLRVDNIMDVEFINALEHIVNDLIKQISGDNETIYIFSKKPDNPTLREIDYHKPTIIVW